MPASPGRAEHLEATHLVHHEIGDNHVELLGGEGLERLPATGGRHHRQALALEVTGEHEAHVGVVVNHEHAALAHATVPFSYSGSHTTNEEPSAGRLRASMVPP